MSSILRALKKVENESGLPVNRRFWHPAAVPGAARLLDVLKRVTVLMLIGCTLASAWYLVCHFAGWSGRKQVSIQGKQALVLDLPEAKSSEINQESPASKSKDILSEKKMVLHVQEPEKPAHYPEESSDPGSNLVRVDGADSMLHGQSPENRDPKDGQPLTSFMSLEENFSLKALAWAPESEKRVVVIDNKVLREGDVYETYQVVAINQENVVLGRDGRRYRLTRMRKAQ